MSVESQVVEYVEQELFRCGAYFMNIHGSNFSGDGKPDFAVCLNGNFIAIECKKRGNRPSISQCRRALEILRAGGRYYVAYEDFDIRFITGEKDAPVITVASNEFETYDLLSRTKNTYMLGAR